MLIEYDRYSIASHYVTALENGDYTGLEDHEEEELENFLNTLPRGYHCWQWSEDTQFSKDEVTGLMADCVEGILYVESASV